MKEAMQFKKKFREIAKRQKREVKSAHRFAVKLGNEINSTPITSSESGKQSGYKPAPLEKYNAVIIDAANDFPDPIPIEKSGKADDETQN